MVPDPLHRRALLPCAFQSWRSGCASLFCATAKLHDTQFDEIGQWVATLTNKNVKKLTPLFAQVGVCRHLFGEKFEKESFLPVHRSVRTSMTPTDNDSDGDGDGDSDSDGDSDGDNDNDNDNDNDLFGCLTSSVL